MAECMFPLFVKSRKDERLKFNIVPCGKCPVCLANRASAWSCRLIEEDKKSISSSFITLTYDTSNLPITKNGYGTIKKRDLQLFFKRLRKSHGESAQKSIKYYAVGEYGGKLKRPHYHIILFNAKIDKIQSAWGLGNVHYGKVSGASVGYTLKYISKPYKNFRINDDREKPFSLMSKGLGESYLTPQMIAWHKADIANRCYYPLPDGKKASLPRYWKERMYSEVDKEVIAANQRQKFAEKILQDLFKVSGIRLKEIQNKTEGKWSAVRRHKLECVNS